MRHVLWRAAVIMAMTFLATGCFLFPIPSTDATLRSLGIDGYSLDKAFDPAVTEYKVLVPYSVAQVKLSAEVTSALAVLSYSVPDKDAIPVALGPTVVTLTVGAEDALVTKTYKVTIYRCNTTVQVEDSVNGSLLPATGISWKVYDGVTLLETFVATANPQYIYVEPGKTRKIEALVAGRASSSREGVVVNAGENKLTRFVSQKSGMSTFPAESPVLGAFEYTMATDPYADAAQWYAVTNGDYISLNQVSAFRILVTGHSEMAPTSWAGKGVTLGIDIMPSYFNWGLPVDGSKLDYDELANLFSARATFAFAGSSIIAGTHTLNIVVYDRANNRLEKSYTIRNASAATPGADISANYVRSLAAELKTIGMGREYLFGIGKDAMPVTVTGGTNYQATVSFSFTASDSDETNIPILGFKVYRSSDAVNFAQVGLINYGSLSTGTAGVHTYKDAESTLEVNRTYWFKVVAFTDDSHMKESAVTSATLLPPFTTSLVAPATESTLDVSVKLPDYVFSISDPAILSGALANDLLYFAPAIKQKNGPYVFYGEFYYRFGATPFLAFRFGSNFHNVLGSFPGSLSDYIVIDGGTITLKSALLNQVTNMWNYTPIAYQSGVTFEWDMFGNNIGTLGTISGMNPVFLQRTGVGGGISRSYADAYEKGNQTINGWFEFTVK